MLTALQTVVIFGLINAAVIFAVSRGAVPEVAIKFPDTKASAARYGFDAFVAYSTASLAAAAILVSCGIAGLVGAAFHAPVLTWGGAAIAAVALFSVLVSLAYVNRLVFEDFGVHIYEFDILDVLRDGVERRHIGVRAEDLAKIYLLVAVVVAGEAALFAFCGVAASWNGSDAAAMAGGLLVAFGLAGAAVYAIARRFIPASNAEFFDSLPLGDYLLPGRPGRPFIDVAVRRGPAGYPSVDDGEDAPAISNRKNVVILISDGLRRDHVMPSAGLTPNIDAFIARHRPAVAKRHLSASHFTDQSLFGLLYGVDGHNFVPFLQERIPCYPIELLKRAGYATTFITHSILNKFPNNWMMDLFDTSSNAASDDDVVDRLRRFVTERRTDKQPYFAVAFVYPPHWPYEFKDAFAIDQPHTRSPHAAAQAKLATRNSYRNSVRQADDYFRQVTELIAPDIERGDTLFVFTSDHGTEFWEHDTIIGQGKSTFWREKIEVPLLIAGKDIHGPLPRSVSGHADVMPTLMEFLDAAIPGAARYSTGSPLQRESAEPLIVSGRLFPYANRTNVVVQNAHKYWLRASKADGGALASSPFRAMTLDDEALPGSSDTDAGFAAASAVFENRFHRYLDIVGGTAARHIRKSSPR